MALQPYSVSKGLQTGAVAGVVGSLVQGILGYLLAQSVGQEIFFVKIATNLGVGDSSVVGGWALHILTGLIVGAIFVSATLKIDLFHLGTTGKAVWVGALAGIAVWVVLLLPATAIFLPGDLGASDFLVGSLIFHVIFGVVTAIAAYMLLRRAIQKDLPAKVA